MQKVRYNFRQADSARELNEHFLGISIPGVKWGFTVQPVSGLTISVAPGSLLTREGVSITETAPLTFSLDGLENQSHGRIDALVAEYILEEKINPNICTYRIIKGNESEDPVSPDVLGSGLYVIAFIGLSSSGIHKAGILYPNAESRIDISKSDFGNGDYSMIRPQISVDSQNINMTSGTVVVDGLKTKIFGLSARIPDVADDAIGYTVNSGLVQRQVQVAKHQIPSMVMVQSSGDLSTITAIEIKYYASYEDYLAGRILTYSAGSNPFRQYYSDGKVHLPIQDCVAISSIAITGQESIDLTVIHKKLVPVVVVGLGIAGEAALAIVTGIKISDTEIKYYINDNISISSDRCMLLGYFHGSEPFRIVNRYGNRMIFHNEYSHRGLARVYHFLGHTGYTLAAMENEPTEFFDSEDIIDTVGTHTMFKSNLYSSIYHTGSGDPNKPADYTLSINS